MKGTFGPKGTDTIFSSTGLEDIPIAGASATVYTRSFSLSAVKYCGVWLKAASSGSINFTVTLEQGIALPTTEGAADANWVTPDGMAAIFTGVNSTVAHINSLSPAAMPYARFKIVSSTGNHATTTAQMKLAKQEEI